MARAKKDDIDIFMDYDIHIPTKTMYMGSHGSDEDGESGVDHAMAERVIKGLHVLDALQNDLSITIIMNNIGGDVIHGMGIFDAIKLCKSHVVIKTIGYAMSMGSIILQAADHRSMSQNSRIMIHYGSLGVSNHAKITYKEAEDNKKYDKVMEELFLEKMKDKEITYSQYLTLIGKKDEIPTNSNSANKKIKITIKELTEMLNFDTFIDAETALELGLIDEILKEP